MAGSGESLGSLLLRLPQRTARELGVKAWPPPPPQTSPYDQRLLVDGEEDLCLTRGEMFELFARHKADPAYWSPKNLAQHYSTSEHWVEALLEVAAPPKFVQVHGEEYGVHAIRPTSELR